MSIGAVNASISLLAYSVASLILAALVTVAAHGMEQSLAPVWSVKEATTAAEEPDPWCKTLNGRPICVGEPN